MTPKLALLILVQLVCSQSSFAAPVPPVEEIFRWRLTGGQGFDQEIVRVHGDSEEFESGFFYLRFDVRHQRLLDYRLPRFSVTQYCGYHRLNGGSVGDYKPKSVLSSIFMVSASGSRLILWGAGTFGQDYNDTPIVNTYDLSRRGSRIDLRESPEQLRMLENLCRSGARQPKIRLQWGGFTRCRWKPEDWHKPVQFHIEYTPPLNAVIEKDVVVRCENF